LRSSLRGVGAILVPSRRAAAATSDILLLQWFHD
jgi:hypothetical protein